MCLSLGYYFYFACLIFGRPLVNNEDMAAQSIKINELLEATVKQVASDLHLAVDLPPILRIDGVLTKLTKYDPLTSETLDSLIKSMMTAEQFDEYKNNMELDFSFAYGDDARFRVNAYHELGRPSAALRLIPAVIPEMADLNLPPVCSSFAQLRQGLVLVTGPTGHGKSTSLAAMLNEINKSRAEHIITVEDPIEYVHTPNKSLISQREMHGDTHSWKVALKSVLREDPDVVFIGEMRDFDTIAAALTIAETGHLVFATLHTNSAAQTIDRIVDVFPPHQQGQIRIQLAATLRGVFSQRLLPSIKGGRVIAYEILLSNPAVQTTVREGKTHMIDNIIMTSADIGMQIFEVSLANLVSQGLISSDVAMQYSVRPEELTRMIYGKRG